MAIAIFGAGYVPSQLHSDVGPITPLFLPIASEPAVFRILKNVKHGENILIFLPNNFTNNELLELVIREKTGFDVKCLELEPHRNRLIDTFICAAEAALDLGEDLEIIFADTISGEISGKDKALIYPVNNPSRWTTCDTDFKKNCTYFPKSVSKGSYAFVGHFHFSNPQSLKKICSRISTNQSELDLAEILNSYKEENPNFEVQITNQWIDLGHLDTYFSTRKLSLASRSFNSIQSPNTYPSIVKSSTNISKIKSEINWFKFNERLDESVSPRMLDWNYEQGSYKLEWVPFLTVGETFSFARMDYGYWESFVSALDKWSGLVWREIKSEPGCVELATREIFIDKLLARWSSFKLSYHVQIEKGFNFEKLLFKTEKNIKVLVQNLKMLIEKMQLTSTGFHGDPVFSNLFFDVRSEKLLSIDPRGSYGEQEIWGTKLYDLAKISQSFFGRYDMVSADLFRLEFGDLCGEIQLFPSNNFDSDLIPIYEWIKQRSFELGITLGELRTFEASLWLSLAVLHDESPRRQMAALIIANKIIESELI